MKVYLCSKVKYILGEIKEDLSNFKNKKAVVLPWSFPNEFGSEDLEEKWIIPGMSKYYDRLTELGFEVIVENCFKKTQEEIEKDIQESGLLIITGGNPHMLLKQLSPYKNILSNYNGVVIGESAGAEIFFNDYYIMKENSFIQEQEHLNGIGLINEFYVDVHSIEEESYLSRLQQISEITSKPMYFMDNTSAIEYNFETKDIKCVGNAKKVS